MTLFTKNAYEKNQKIIYTIKREQKNIYKTKMEIQEEKKRRYLQDRKKVHCRCKCHKRFPIKKFLHKHFNNVL